MTSIQPGEDPDADQARTRQTLLDTAIRMIVNGFIPSVAEVAEASEVPRATAYRCFPTQSALVAAAVNEGLEPLVDWSPKSTDVIERIEELLRYAYPRLERYEPIFRASVQLSLQQLAQEKAGKFANEVPLVRGHRVTALKSILAPLLEPLGEERFNRLMQALSLTYGVEVFLILKDIWHLKTDEVIEVACWTAKAILSQAVREISLPPEGSVKASDIHDK